MALHLTGAKLRGRDMGYNPLEQGKEEDLAFICIHHLPAALSCTLEELQCFALLLLPIGHR